MNIYINKYIELRKSIPEYDWKFNGCVLIINSIEENKKYQTVCEIFDKMDEILDIVEKKYKINSIDFFRQVNKTCL
jgi:hypothetical protein